MMKSGTFEINRGYEGCQRTLRLLLRRRPARGGKSKEAPHPVEKRCETTLQSNPFRSLPLRCGLLRPNHIHDVVHLIGKKIQFARQSLNLALRPAVDVEVKFAA